MVYVLLLRSRVMLLVTSRLLMTMTILRHQPAHAQQVLLVPLLCPHLGLQQQLLAMAQHLMAQHLMAQPSPPAGPAVMGYEPKGGWGLVVTPTLHCATLPLQCVPLTIHCMSRSLRC